MGTSVPGVPRRPRPNQRCYLHLWCRFFCWEVPRILNKKIELEIGYDKFWIKLNVAGRTGATEVPGNLGRLFLQEQWARCPQVPNIFRVQLLPNWAGRQIQDNDKDKYKTMTKTNTIQRQRQIHRCAKYIPSAIITKLSREGYGRGVGEQDEGKILGLFDDDSFRWPLIILTHHHHRITCPPGHEK